MKLTRLLTACFVMAVISAACSDNEPDKQSNKAKTAVESKTSLNNASLPTITESFSVGKNVYVRALKYDPESNSLWVGTSVGVLEVNLENNEVLHNFTRNDGLANEYVFAIGLDRYGYKWFGTNAGGVSRYRDGEWKTYFPMHGLADYWVYSFAQQKSGNYWIGTWAGANEVNLENMEFKTYVKELINEWVYAIDIDSNDRVWFGTEGGVSMYNGENWQQWSHKDGMGAENTGNLPLSPNTGLGTRSRHDLNVMVDNQESYNPNYVFALHVDPDNKIWVGTWGGGVSCFDGEKWTNFTTENGLAGNIVYSIEQTKNGVFWFGTNHGLSRYDGKSWKNYNMSDGLLGDNVYAITSTDDNNIWVGTINGVAHLGYKN